MLILTALAFLPTLDGGFIADDFVYIARFRDFPWLGWPRLFTHEWSEGVWGQALHELRPMTALSFMGDARLFAGNALGYRVTNLALHLGATFLVLRLAWHYTQHATATLIASTLFALHPANMEAVAWITGRVDLLATTGALLFWLAGELFSSAGRRVHLLLGTGALFIGIFAKELCMFAPPLLLGRWLLLDFRAERSTWHRRLLVLAGGLVVIGIYAGCRRAAFGPENLGYNVWTDSPAWNRQVSYASWLVPVLPFTSQVEWKNFPSLTLTHAIWIVLAALVAGGLGLALRRGSRTSAGAWYFGGLWYFVTVAPFTAVVYMSPRHLYFPLVGLALASAFLVIRGRLGLVLCAVFVIVCSAGHFAAIQPWRQSAKLSRDALRRLDQELVAAGRGTLLVTSAPATMGPVLFWVWSSPQCFSPPFLAHPPARLIEQPVMISRPVDWHQARRPLETMRAAQALVALRIDPRGRVVCRRVPAGEFTSHVDSLARRIERGIDPDSWDAWVQSVAEPGV